MRTELLNTDHLLTLDGHEIGCPKAELVSSVGVYNVMKYDRSEYSSLGPSRKKRRLNIHAIRM